MVRGREEEKEGVYPVPRGLEGRELNSWLTPRIVVEGAGRQGRRTWSKPVGRGREGNTPRHRSSPLG